jgi:ectoine hydroxylase-related dioxygenase (phytanoyl-CoA dioxygenase family)
LTGRIDTDLLENLSNAVDACLDTTGFSADEPGVFSFNLTREQAPDVFDALHRSAMWSELLELVAPSSLEHFDGVTQVAFNVPPNDREPAEPHVDHHARGAQKPDSFTILLAILLTDQTNAGEGNVVVWPGTHLLHAEYLAAYGPSALLEGAGRVKQVAPAVHLPRPVSVCGRRGDVLLMHPLLGHESGANYGDAVRRAVYFRLRRSDHEERWEECVTNPLLEYNLDRATN